MNTICISGNLTRDPELKSTESGIMVCPFTVAVHVPHTKNKTAFVDCVAWRERAEFVSRYFHKGSRIEITGYISTRLFGNDGNTKKATEIQCAEIGFGEKKKETESDTDEDQIQQENDDDMPF